MKTILSYLFFASLLLVLSPLAQAQSDDFIRINAVAGAKANAKRNIILRQIEGTCVEVLEAISGEGGSPECQDLRVQCETEIQESFRNSFDREVEECVSLPEEDDDCGIILLPSEIAQECRNGERTEGCDQVTEACKDGETPRSRCLDGIRFDFLRAKAVAIYKIRLRNECRPLEEDPETEEPVNNQNPDLGDNPGLAIEEGQVVAADGATGGCTLSGPGTAADFWNALWLIVPMLGLRGRKTRR